MNSKIHNRILSRLAYSLASVAVAGTFVLGGAAVAGAAQPAGSTAGPSAATAASKASTVHITSHLVVSNVAPTSPEFTREAQPVREGVSPRISCGQYLTYYETARYTEFGQTFVQLTSTDYTQWCSGRTWTESYGVYCHNLYFVAANFFCMGGASWGIIGQGSYEVNPWYNQPVKAAVVTPDGVEIESATAYCRNYMAANGYNNEWCSLTW